MTFHLNRIGASAAVGAAALAFAAGCSSSSGTSAAPAPSQTSAAAPSAPAPSAAGAGVMTTTAPGLGSIIVDSTGRTIYRYDKDSNTPPTSNCTGGCLAAWPPVPATTTVTGIASSLIGSITGSDGSKQLTIGGWPVYYFAQDSAPGQVSGQGVGGIWWVLAPNGSEVKAAAGGSGGTAGSAANSSNKSSGNNSTASSSSGGGW
jgi:predicted lipoprotein with Yx(FWY)xxD motif